ncbi:MAG: response regulator, partial [Enterobacterales bacterium]|nr:response regulator [Enterobacterales bacterium]
NECILIVDDEEEVCQMAADILSEYGYKTYTVQSAIDALTYLQTNTIDLILTDVVMPQMDGYLFTSKVNKLYPEIKIQLMSGFSDNQDDSLISKQLLDQMLLKPFEPIDLVRQIDSVLNDT